MDNTHEIFSLLKISNRIKPATLKNVTDKSERALEKSKETRKHILHIYKSVQETKYSDVIMQQSEDIKEFLKSESDYLLDDMAKNYDFSLEDFNNLNRDLNEQINSMYNETSSGYGSANCNRTNTNLDDVDLERYKHSLKSLNEMIIMNKNLKKLQIIDMEECQNMKELEKKLTMYIKEVESLTKMVEAKSSFAEHKEKWSIKQQLDYNTIQNYVCLIENIKNKTNELIYELSINYKK